ncbi:MAG: dihydrolipoamide acetyltransferase family protein [Bacteroidales bacterium]
MGFAEVKIPSMGEGIIEATIIRWLVKEGEPVEVESPLVEIATDKVDSEIPSPAAGILKKILRPEGDIPRVGETIALIELQGNTEQFTEPVANINAVPPPHERQQFDSVVPDLPPQPDTVRQPMTAPMANQTHPVLSPFIKMAAREMGIDPGELLRIKGTALGNRITKKDFFRYLEQKMMSEENIPPAPRGQEGNSVAGSGNPPAPPAIEGPHELVKMDRIRKLIAGHMVMSKKTAPHVTSFYEADFTTLVQWRNQHKDEFQKKYGEKLTFTPLFVDAVAKALQKYPQINASLDGDNIIIRKDINIGIATALPDGNLIVPVIRKAETLNLEGLARKINDLARRARENRLNPAEITGGSFTITNLGMFSSLTGTPIINQPESAILAIGAILRKPAVVQGPFGESIGIRDICVLSLSYDHRIIDGALGGMFLKEVAELLEKWPISRMF